MNNTFNSVKVTCDAFLSNGLFNEDYAAGAWNKEDKTKEELNNGIMFIPLSNILYDDFLKQAYEQRIYCLTQINREGHMYSFIFLSHRETFNLIEEKKTDVNGGDTSNLVIYDQADGLTFEAYVTYLSK
jgi:hypothetical protein